MPSKILIDTLDTKKAQLKSDMDMSASIVSRAEAAVVKATHELAEASKVYSIYKQRLADLNADIEKLGLH